MIKKVFYMKLNSAPSSSGKDIGPSRRQHRFESGRGHHNLIPKQFRSIRLIRSAREVRAGCLRRVSVWLKHDHPPNL